MEEPTIPKEFEIEEFRRELEHLNVLIERGKSSFPSDWKESTESDFPSLFELLKGLIDLLIASDFRGLCTVRSSPG